MATTVKEITCNMISQDDIVIVLMGPTGTGKSSFIDTATGQKGKHIGHALKSSTSDIRAVAYPHPATRKQFILVDTPGFDDTNRSNTEILSMFADWLKKLHEKSIRLDGIIYLHRISDNRMSGSTLQNLRMFAKVCGDDAIKNVALITTMWTKVGQDVGKQREKELKERYWAELLNRGARAIPFRDSFEASWQILDQIADPVGAQRKCEPLLLQEELVIHGRPLNETEAGKMLCSELQQLLTEQRKTLRQLRDEAKAVRNQTLAEELTLQCGAMQDAIRSTCDQLEKMRIPLRRRFLMSFSWNKLRGYH